MPRWANYGKLDTPILRDGDASFTSLNMKLDRALLPEGTLARSENKRLRDGVAATRLGNVLGGDFNPVFANPIIGSGIYRNPSGDEVMLVATLGADYVWVLQYGKDPMQIDLDAGEDFAGVTYVQFCQAFDKVLCFRTPPVHSNLTLVWDGDITHTFDAVTTPGPGTLIPFTFTGEPFQNRVLLYSPFIPINPWRDQIIMTDILDYTQYDPVFSVFRINAGEGDYITRVHPYFKGSVIVGKRRSIHMLTDFTVDSLLASQRLLSRRVGNAGLNGMVEVGGDVLFTSEPGGIYRLSEVIQEQIQAEPRAISDDIQPIIDRINWRDSVHSIIADSIDIYAYFFYPIDGTTGGANVAAVYNTITNKFESIDHWADPGFKINAVHATQYDGSRSLFGLDYINRRIYVLYKGAVDEINGDEYPIDDLIETRGYILGDPIGFKRIQRSAFAIRTAHPEVTVTAITDGVNEEKPVTDVPLTKSRINFYPFDHDEYDTITGDSSEPYREDYAGGELIDFAGEDFANLPVGPISILPPTPLLTIGDKQQSLERYSVGVNGRWVSLRIQNISGNCDVLATSVEGIGTEETKTAA